MLELRKNVNFDGRSVDPNSFLFLVVILLFSGAIENMTFKTLCTFGTAYRLFLVVGLHLQQICSGFVAEMYTLW